jgi:GNAT superfamily N-acetyltransferase
VNVKLRPAVAGDAASLGAILSDWIDTTPWMPRLHTRDEDRGFVGHLIVTTEVTVAELGGDPAGFLARDREEIPALYLAGLARGQGFGTALLRRAQDAAERLTLWTFQANAGAIRFYHRAGFSEAERTDGARNDEKLPDVRLVWTRTTA